MIAGVPNVYFPKQEIGKDSLCKDLPSNLFTTIITLQITLTV